VNANVVSFLADSLALWQVEGTVTAGALPVVAVIRAGDCTVWVEQNADYAVPWRDAGMHEERSRPAASLTGMLNAARRALNVERGNALRVVAAAAEGS